MRSRLGCAIAPPASRSSSRSRRQREIADVDGRSWTSSPGPSAQSSTPSRPRSWSSRSAEREQLELNRRSLEARLKAIPEEIERESEQVRRRYADPKPRLFPVAVTFLVPERLARGAR